MQFSLISIGNSKGFRIPKNILEECGITDTVNANIINGKLIISADHPRAGWQKAFQLADTTPIKEDKTFASISNEWDQTEWQW